MAPVPFSLSLDRLCLCCSSVAFAFWLHALTVRLAAALLTGQDIPQCILCFSLAHSFRLLQRRSSTINSRAFAPRRRQELVCSGSTTDARQPDHSNARVSELGEHPFRDLLRLVFVHSGSSANRLHSFDTRHSNCDHCDHQFGTNKPSFHPVTPLALPLQPQHCLVTSTKRQSPRQFSHKRPTTKKRPAQHRVFV